MLKHLTALHCIMRMLDAVPMLTNVVNAVEYATDTRHPKPAMSYHVSARADAS